MPSAQRGPGFVCEVDRNSPARPCSLARRFRRWHRQRWSKDAQKL